MSFVSYFPVDQIPYVQSPVFIDDNQPVGYKWYQSSLSSDVLAASPCSCGCQTQFLQNPVGNPNLYYPVEYRPPEPPPLSSHSNSPHVTVNPYYYPSHMFHDAEPPQSPNLPTTEFRAPYMHTPPFTLTCHTTLSSGQPYYALEFENPITTPCSTLTPMPSDKHECNGVIQISAVDVVNGDSSNLVEKAVEVQKELVVDAVEVEPQVFDKSPVRNSALVDEHVCADDLSHDDDSSIWMTLPIIQHSISILQYIEEFVRVKSRAEFNFKCDFEDNFLAYCFVEGLQEEIREALELCAPQTLQEAIYLATFQELLLEEELLFEATKDGAAIGECQAILVKESFMVQANNKEEKKYDGLNDELELQVERRVAVTTYVNEMFAENFGVGKQAFVEDIHLVTLSNMEESVEAFVDMEETSFTVPVCVADPLKRLARNIDVSFSLTVMQIISPPRAFTIANDLDKWYIVNAGKKNLRNFDPGGDKIAASIFTTKVGILEFLLEDQGYARQRNVSDTTMAYDKMVKAGIKFNSVSWNGMLAEFNRNGHHLVQQLSLKLNEVLALRIANAGGLGCQILYYCSHMVVNLFMGRCLKEEELVEIGIMGKKREKGGVEGFDVLHKVYKFFCLLGMSSRSNAERFASSIANEFLTTIRKQFHNPDLKSGPYPGAPPNALLSKHLQQSSSHDVSVVGYVAPEYVHDYAWCRNDSVLVFDPGGNRIHFALHLKNILVCKDFQIFVLGNEESTYVLLENSGQHITTDVSYLPSDPIEMLYLLRLADDKRMLASLEQHILLHNTELVYGTAMDAATVEVPVHILIGSTEKLVFEALREHWHVVNGMHQLVHYATSEDAWCGSDVKLVFDPGGCDCWLQRCVQGSHILEDKDILRVMDCNGPDKYYPTWTGLLFHLGHLTDLDYKPNPFLLKIAWL